MKEATTVVAEEPKKVKKVKEGTAEAGAEKVAKVAKVKTPKSVKYSLISGVDVATFRGQRAIVVKALQSLGEGFFSPEEIAAKCDGLQSKTPVLASATYHLKGLLEDGQVESQDVTPTAAPAVAETVAA